jgi:hypothetical protein
MSCPHPARLQAYTAGALPDDQADAMRVHVAACDDCRRLARTFAGCEPDAAEPAAVEALWSRISPRVEAVRPAKSRSRRLLLAWAAAPVAAAAAFLVLFVSPPKTPLVMLVPPAPPAAPSVDLAMLARFEPPPVELPLEDLLVTRGAGVPGIPPGLTAAFQVYQKGDFAGAAQRFAALERQGIARYEVFLYQGVSLLAAGRPAEAVPALRRASGAAAGERRPQAQWYLAVALLRQNEVTAAREQLQSVCESGHAQAAEACGVLRGIAGEAR